MIIKKEYNNMGGGKIIKKILHRPRIVDKTNDKNLIIDEGFFSKEMEIYVSGSNNTIILGYNSSLANTKFHIVGCDNTIHIGKDCRIRDLLINIEDNGNQVCVGDNTTIHGKTELAAIEGTRLIIDNDCMFSNNITIRTGDSHSILDISGARINHSEDVYIGNHVWIGASSMVLKGARVGDDVVIGAGSVVSRTTEYSCGVIIAGIPGRIIKRGIGWSRDRL